MRDVCTIVLVPVLVHVLVRVVVAAAAKSPRVQQPIMIVIPGAYVNVNWASFFQLGS